MTRKERILNFLQKLPDDVSFDRVLYHVSVMRDIEAGLAESDRGQGVEHEELFRRLLKKNEKNQGRLVTSRPKESRANKSKYSSRQTNGRRKVRQKT